MSTAISGSVGAGLGSMAAGTFGWTAATWTQVGWTAGVLIGSYIFAEGGPDIVQEGPRLDDLKVTTSTYGMDIPIVYGSYRISGNIIWSLPLQETRHEETQDEGKGGGGGGSSTTVWYTYEANFAVALCEGPINSVRKIWFGSKLVYNNGRYLEGLTASAIKVYTGTDTQNIDWRMQSDNADTPAYRHTCYIVFSGIQLENYGNIIPSVTCEVISGGTNDVAAFKSPENLVATWVDEATVYATCALVNTYVHDNPHPILIQFDGSTSRLVSMPIDTYNGVISAQFVLYNNSQPILTNTANTYNSGISGDCRRSFYYLHRPLVASRCKTGWISCVASSNDWNNFVRYYDDANSFAAAKVINAKNPIGDVGAYSGIEPNAQSTTQGTFYKDHFYFLNAIGKSVLKGAGTKDYPKFNFDDYPGDLSGFTSYTAVGSTAEGSLEAIVGSSTYSGEELTSFDVNYDRIYILTNGPNVGGIYSKYIEIRDLDGLLLDKINITNDTTTADVSYTNMPMFVDDEAIHIIRFDRDNGTYYNKYDLDGTLILKRYPSSFGDIVENWVSYFDLYGSENLMYKNGLVKFIPRLGFNPNYYSEDITINLNYAVGSTTLKTITDDLCSRVGLDTIDYDNTAGTSIFVNGYVVSKNMSSRAALEPLLSTYDFMMVETNNKIELRPMNSTSVATIYQEDMGANEGNNIEQNISQEIDKLKSLTIKYANSGSDYQTSTQYAMRVDLNATEERIVELPLVLTDSEAKQIAEKNLFNSWITRQTFSISLPSTYKDLIASDIITIQLYDSFIDVRLTKVTITTDDIVKCNAITVYTDIYTSNAIGSDTGSNGSELAEPAGISNLEILDIPTLDNDFINTEGLYIALTGYTDSWNGGTVYSKTVQEDDTKVDLVLIGSPTPIGTTMTELQPGSTNVWDLNNTVDLFLNIDISTYSTTIEDVLMGNNYILIGDEILQFQTATAVDSIIRLENLLRGRRGTEHAINTHVIGERAILLGNTTIGFSTRVLNSIGYYNAVTLNTSEASELKELQYVGNNIKPFSVAYLKAVLETDNSITLTWMKRSRYISGYLKTLPAIDLPESYSILINSTAERFSSTSTFNYTDAMKIEDGYAVDDTFSFDVTQIGKLYGYSTNIIL